MYYLKDLCFICLKHDKHLQRLRKDNCGNKNYYSKIASSVPEMVSSVLDKHGMICSECCSKLETVHEFREQCLRNKHLLMDYVSKLHSVSQTSGILNVRMKDLKCKIKNSVQNFEQFENLYYKTDDLIVKTANGYIVTSSTSVKDYDNIDRIKTKTKENENPLASSSAGETGYEGCTNYMFHNATVGEVVKERPNITKACTTELKTGNSDTCSTAVNVIIKEEFDIKTEYEVLGDINEEDDLESSAYDNECSGPSGFKYSEATDELLDNKTNIDSILTEEFDKFEQEEDTSEYEVDESETTTDTDEDTEMSQTHVKKHAKTKPELRQCNTTIFIKGKEPNMKRFECDRCRRTFSEKNTLIRHQRIHTGEKPFKCDHCGQNFSQRGTLIRHERIHTGQKPFKCEHCGQTFSRRDTFISHQRLHTGEIPFKCDHCGQSFSLRSNLIRHERIHTGEKPFKCDHCGQTFSQRGNLITHQRIHTGEKPFKCDHCGQTFAHRFAFTGHLRIHTGEKPFRCDHCGQSFSLRSNLIRHERIHTGEKPFKCDHCGQTFSQRGNLITHQQIHTGEKQFKCDHCGQTFAHRFAFTGHLRIHTGEKPFRCDHCGKTFSHRQQLNRHKRIHTRETV